MSKVTVVGAGNVGATVANVLAHKDIVKEIVLLDIIGDLAKGKALDSWQQAPIDYYSTSLVGTSDYRKTRNSRVENGERREQLHCQDGNAEVEMRIAE